MSAPQSALAVLAGEAESSVIARFRDRFDPVAALGMPAHITVLYPFIPPDSIAGDVLGRLRGLFASHRVFAFSLREVRRFPGVLYLQPEPAEPFRALTRDVHAAFPAFPPYGGVHADIVPHLTFAHASSAKDLESIAAEFKAASETCLPLRVETREVALLDNASGTWRVREMFELGGD